MKDCLWLQTALPHDCTRPNTTWYAEKDINVLADKFGYGLASDPVTPAFANTIDWIANHPSVGAIGIWANSPSAEYMALVGSWLHQTEPKQSRVRFLSGFFL